LKEEAGGETDMKCHTPDCIGEHEAGTISHSVIYRERTLVLHGVPAHICPECGDAVLHDETLIVIEDQLKRKSRSKATAFHYGK